MNVSEAIKKICNVYLGKFETEMIQVYDEVIKKGKISADDLYRLQDIGLPITTLVSNFKSVDIYKGRELLKRGEITASDLEQILINYAQSKA